MTDNWMDDPMMRAAAMEGISENLAFPLSDRLGAARQANELLHKRIEELERQRDEVLGLTTEYDALGNEMVIRFDHVQDIYRGES